MGNIGHNSVPSDELLKIIEDVEKLMEDRKAVSDTIKEALDGAESRGFDKKTIREMIRIRAMEKEEREEREQLRAVYLLALGLE